MDYKRLPVWREATRLMVEIENVVRCFSKYHRYTVGAELRSVVMRIGQVLHRAFSRKNNKHKLVQQLAELIEDLKLQIQIAKELHAFRSFAQFESISVLVVSLGKQVGGWLKHTRAEWQRRNSAASDSTHCAPGAPSK